MKYDICIVGAGPGGADAALLLAQAGKKVVLVERGEVGGECLNWGCVPTKALVNSASYGALFKEAARFGVAAGVCNCNWNNILRYKDRVVTTLRTALTHSLETAGVELVKATAKLKSKNLVTLDNGTEIEAEYIILATGSVPVVPPVFTLTDKIVTSKQVYESPDLPASILIVGGGVIGLEFASFLNSFGTQVTIVEMLPRLLANEDEDTAQELTKIFERRGIKILSNTKLLSLKETSNLVQAEFEQAGQVSQAEFEKVLIAVGRKPAIQNLGLEEVGIVTERGIKVNEKFQTNVSNIYAIGDVTGNSILAYLSSVHGKLVAYDILGIKKDFDLSVYPRCIFTDPEIASCGVSEQELQKKGVKYVLKKVNYAANGKATILGRREGFLKLLLEESTEKLLGAAVIGHEATLLIDKAVLAISQEMTAKQLERIIVAHPVLAELYTQALEN